MLTSLSLLENYTPQFLALNKFSYDFSYDFSYEFTKYTRFDTCPGIVFPALLCYMEKETSVASPAGFV